MNDGSYFGSLKLALYDADENICETTVLPDYIQDMFNELGSLSNEYKALFSKIYGDKLEFYDERDIIFIALYKATDWYKEAAKNLKDMYMSKPE